MPEFSREPVVPHVESGVGRVIRGESVVHMRTEGDLSAPIVAMGWNSERFDDRNLALRMVALGWTQVYWYRGGREAWEVAGKPGFTGESSGARALAAGYPWAAGWEVMNYLDDPTRSVDDLMNSVYHRVGMLIWTHQYLGYGHGRSAGEAVDVLDFGRPMPVLVSGSTGAGGWRPPIPTEPGRGDTS